VQTVNYLMKATKMQIDNVKKPVNMQFKDRPEALNWLRSRGLIMQYIVIDTNNGCVLRADDTFSTATPKASQNRSKS
jgi:hypothetical protein